MSKEEDLRNEKFKNVIISKRCTIQLFWREYADIHYISFVMCITAAYDYLRPIVIQLLLTLFSFISLNAKNFLNAVKLKLNGLLGQNRFSSLCFITYLYVT